MPQTLKERLAALTPEQRAELGEALGTGNTNLSDLLKTVEALQADVAALKKGPAPPKGGGSWWDQLFGAG